MSRAPSGSSTPSRLSLHRYGSFEGSRPVSPALMPANHNEARRLSQWSRASEHFDARPVSIHANGMAPLAVQSGSRSPDATMNDMLDGADPTDSSVRLQKVDRKPSILLKPHGVQKMECVNAGLKGKGHVYLYAGIYLITMVQSLESNGSPVIEPYFLSGFHAHSMISSIAIVTNLAYGLGRPPMAKILDHFGRAEATAVSAALYGIGFICTGLSRDVIFYAIAKTIGSLGGTGLQLCIAVLIADTTTLSNRALVSSTIAIPWLLTIWVGPVLASAALEHGQAGQRAFYIAFGIAVPLLCLPLVFTLRRTYARVSHALLRKISRSDLSIDDVGDSMQYMKEILQQHKDFEEAQTFGSRARQAWQQIDAPGIALLTLSGAFILLPFSLAATRPESWSDPAVYLFIALGVVCGYLFRRHERTAAFPFISERLLYNRTVRAGCALGLFHFVCQFTYESYFTSWLQVARLNTARDAQYISQSYLFTACIASLAAGVAVKWSGRYRIWGLIGVGSHIVGALMMVRFRRLDTPTWEVVLSQVVGGVGGGLTTMAQLGIQAVVSHHDLAMVTAIYLTITQLGAAVGGSVAGAVWTTVLPGKLAIYLPPAELPRIREIMGSIVVALSYEPGTPERAAINLAYSDTQWLLQVIALLALGPALVAMWSMEDRKLANQPAESVVVMGRASVASALIDDEEEGSETTSLLSPPR